MKTDSPRYRVFLWLVFVIAGLGPGAFAASEAPPNVILFLCDNLGYGDVGPFGSTLHRTPNLDRMAREGRKFTHLYSASGVCTPSRAALMTGCYPMRVNLHRNAHGGGVLQPVEPIGLNPEEITIAEVLKSRGYATMMLGKWHLGDQPPFLPTRQGFDAYVGVPYSDDMTPREGKNWPPLPLMKDERVIDAPVDRNTLTVRETEDAVRFISQRHERPFFLYVAHAMPGSTLTPFSSPAFRGKSKNGLWGDSVEELDWSVGEVFAALRKAGLDDKTLAIWTSDNGAPVRNPPQGSNHPLGGSGYTTAEGGMRVPLIARWPGRIPAGTECAELATLMDLLPTLAAVSGGKVSERNPIDGKNILPLLLGSSGARSPHEAFYYYAQSQLQAVRSGPWKLHLPLEKRLGRGAKATQDSNSPRLYNVVNDPAEKENLAAAQGDTVKKLLALAEVARVEIGDTDRIGCGQRPAGWVGDPQPVVSRK